MQSVEELSEVAQFINSKTGITKNHIDEDKLLQAIQQNFPHFTSMQSSEKGYLRKLSFISSILRYHNLNSLSVEQSVDGVLFGSIEDKFQCTIVAEPYNSDHMVHKTEMKEKLRELAEDFHRNSEEQVSNQITSNLDMIKVQSIANQKFKIRELYEKILFKLNNDSDAALALTSLFIFELDLVNSLSNRNALFFFDLYDLTNPLDKWFASMHIETTSTTPIFYYNSNILQ
jgi:hypothetical protein